MGAQTNLAAKQRAQIDLHIPKEVEEEKPAEEEGKNDIPLAQVVAAPQTSWHEPTIVWSGCRLHRRRRLHCHRQLLGLFHGHFDSKKVYYKVILINNFLQPSRIDLSEGSTLEILTDVVAFRFV